MSSAVRIVRLLVVLALVPALAGCSLAGAVVDGIRHGIAATSAPTREDADFGTVTVHTVRADASLDPAPTGLAAEVWTTFTRVATPATAGRLVVEYLVGDAPRSDTLAYVAQTADPARWTLAANLATSTVRSDLIATLIHEYAHLLSLGVDQVDPASTDPATCATVVLAEGCVHIDAVLWRFQQRFWTAYRDAPAPDNADAAVADAFYAAHEADFVSGYAATNVTEDFAETFMTFVLEPSTGASAAPAAGTGVLGDKLAFFAAMPAFSAERARIRAEFASELGLA